jgi:DNA-binding HxlR family transcriptional regulator
VLDGPDDEAAFVRLVLQQYAVEVVDALFGLPLTLRRLRKVLGVRRGPLMETLRALAAYGAIRRCGEQGSWDGTDPDGARYELTDIGYGIIELLNRIDRWNDIYQRYLDNHPTDDCRP